MTLNESATRTLCAAPPAEPGTHHPERGEGPRARSLTPIGASYFQVAPRIIWGQLAPEEPFEPLDGWFALPASTGLRLVACFGVHPQRPGVSVTVTEGSRPPLLAREDGSPLFAPTMPGGDAADLHAVTAPAELLLLGWRALAGEEVP